MAVPNESVSINLDSVARQRINRAARLTNQSADSFIVDAAGKHARSVLLEWAVEQHRKGVASYSELADDTGLAVEELMLAGQEPDDVDGLEQFLASSRTLAEKSGNLDFGKAAQCAVDQIRRERRSAAHHTS